MTVPRPLTREQAHAAAQRLISLGFAVIWLRSPTQEVLRQRDGTFQAIPPERRGKAPIAEGWAQGGPTDWPTLERLYGDGTPGYNLAIRTGRVDGAATQIVVLDLDSEDALTWARAQVASHNWPAPTLRVKTARGEHWYYRCPPGRCGTRIHITLADGRRIAADFKADGGYVVAPPSVHGTGHVYEEIEPWTQDAVDDTPTFDPASFPGVAWEDEPEPGVSADDPGARVPPVDVPLERRLDRGRRYLASPGVVEGTYPGMPPSGAGGVCLTVARALVFGLCIPPDRAVELMLDSQWNQNCRANNGDPYPWSRTELDRKCRQAYALRFNKPYGYLLIDGKTTEGGLPVTGGAAPNETAERGPPVRANMTPQEIVADLLSAARDVPSIFDVFPRNDEGNAELWVARYGHVIRYAGGEWLAYAGGVWRHVGEAIVMRTIADALKLRNDEIDEISDENEQMAARSYARKCGNISADRAVRDKLPADILASRDHFDPQPGVYAIAEGYYDFRAGELIPPDPSRYVTRTAAFSRPREGMGCPRWLELLRTCLRVPTDDTTDGPLIEDPELTRQAIEDLQELFGVAFAMGTAHYVGVLFGNGGNGKGIIAAVMRALLSGTLVRSPNPEIFLSNSTLSGNARDDQIAKTAGAVLLFPSELPRGALADRVLKALASTDTQTARTLCKESFEFVPQHKIWLSCNRLPFVSDDNASWRRFRLFRFYTTFVTDRDKVDPERWILPVRNEDAIKEELQSESGAIVAWLREGYLRYVARGSVLGSSDYHRLMIEQWRAAIGRGDASPDASGDYLVDQFLAECTVHVADLPELPEKLHRLVRASRQDIYEAYDGWCDKKSVPRRVRVGKHTLYDLLRKRGFKDHRNVEFDGVALLSALDPQIRPYVYPDLLSLVNTVP